MPSSVSAPKTTTAATSGRPPCGHTTIAAAPQASVSSTLAVSAMNRAENARARNRMGVPSKALFPARQRESRFEPQPAARRWHIFASERRRALRRGPPSESGLLRRAGEPDAAQTRGRRRDGRGRRARPARRRRCGRRDRAAAPASKSPSSARRRAAGRARRRRSARRRASVIAPPASVSKSSSRRDAVAPHRAAPAA